MSHGDILPVSPCGRGTAPSWEGETEARGGPEVCVGRAGPRDR